MGHSKDSEMGRRLACIGLLALLAASAPASARMYQWVNPQTGTTQLTGTPPAWYRSEKGGPRVLVYDNGNLIDDTAVQVAPERGELLRKEAFQQADEQEQLEALRRLEAQARRDAERRRMEAAARAREAEAVAEAEKAAAPSAEPDTLDRSAIERLKAIISAFDRLGAAAPRAAAPESQ